MPRQPRVPSASGYYHVMLRGSGRQLLFEDNADRERFLVLLAEALKAHPIELIAWCLMGNHVHLLVSDERFELGRCMQRLESGYAGHFNRKTGHVGHVFEGRFSSKPIKDDAQLLQTLRYIHNNPLRAGICDARDYHWSSYQEYLGEPGLASTDLVLNMLNGRDGFVRFSSLGERQHVVEHVGRLTEEEALAVACGCLFPCVPSEVKALSQGRRNDSLRRLHEAGLSIRQIERVTGVGRGTVSRACRG